MVSCLFLPLGVHSCNQKRLNIQLTSRDARCHLRKHASVDSCPRSRPRPGPSRGCTADAHGLLPRAVFAGHRASLVDKVAPRQLTAALVAARTTPTIADHRNLQQSQCSSHPRIPAYGSRPRARIRSQVAEALSTRSHCRCHFLEAIQRPTATCFEFQRRLNPEALELSVPSKSDMTRHDSVGPNRKAAWPRRRSAERLQRHSFRCLGIAIPACLYTWIQGMVSAILLLPSDRQKATCLEALDDYGVIHQDGVH